jgi:hypothetical protein
MINAVVEPSYMVSLTLVRSLTMSTTRTTALNAWLPRVSPQPWPQISFGVAITLLRVYLVSRYSCGGYTCRSHSCWWRRARCHGRKGQAASRERGRIAEDAGNAGEHATADQATEPNQLAQLDGRRGRPRTLRRQSITNLEREDHRPATNHISAFIYVHIRNAFTLFIPRTTTPIREICGQQPSPVANALVPACGGHPIKCL